MLQYLILHAALTMGQAPVQQPGWQYPSYPPAASQRAVQVPEYPVMMTDEGTGSAKPIEIPTVDASNGHEKPAANGENGGKECDCKKEEKKEEDCDACKEKKSAWCKCGELGDPIKFSGWILKEKSKWDFGGWVQTGYHSNPTGLPSGIPGVAGVMFNNQPNRVNLHQAWAYVEKKVDAKCGFDWGLRADAVYGIDGPDTQAFGGTPGNWDYLNGWGSGDREAFALPQVYLELAYKDFSVKAGKFFTLIGNETVAATGNFFYSHAFTFFFSEPFTHTGALGTWKVNDKLSVTGGWVAGNDTGFERFNGGSAFLGNFSYDVNDKLNLSYALNYGDLGKTGNGYHQTGLVSWKFMEKFESVTQCDITRYDLGGFDSTAVVNYLFYTLNDCAKLGVRGEWYKVEGISYYDVTAGLNYRPHANVTIRPEYRYQWSPAVQGGAVAPLAIPVDQHIFGVDVIFTF